jgi:hypothetical protein
MKALKEDKFKSLEDEMTAFKQMSEKEACQWYKVDYKEEALPYIREWWDWEQRTI